MRSENMREYDGIDLGMHDRRINQPEWSNPRELGSRYIIDSKYKIV